MIGWIANFFMLFGSYTVGCHNRFGFICQLIGNALWAYIGIKRYEGRDRASLIAISLAFCALYTYNFWKWS